MSTLLAAQAALPASAGSRVLPLQDHASRMFVFSRLVSAFEQDGQLSLTELVHCGFTPDLVDELRCMSMIDALRFTAAPCGLTVNVDPQAMRERLGAVERFKSDRKLYESFIRAGASPQLVSRLFGVNAIDVRRLRRLIAPAYALGGRPRGASADLRTEVAATWARICSEQPLERLRYWALHEAFPNVPIAALEAALDEQPQRGASAAACGTTSEHAPMQPAQSPSVRSHLRPQHEGAPHGHEPC